ncbi:hypothetical protein KC318_g14611 [Hortaea werneckii]|nr:hypothetical protein KC355_g11004 [Hortaea werneckii]KAI7652885.1 hypothetical protein KC318_g14611 [Hortaea werneckii]
MASQQTYSIEATCTKELGDISRAKGNPVPFWNVNVPASLQTKECPEFLQYAFDNAKDRAILSTPDARYQRQSWQEVQDLIKTNRLDLFQRVPTDLRRYREFTTKLAKDYGSVMAFVMQERLRWRDLKPKGRPFEYLEDYKILHNDWPYGVDPRIVHLVVWTKFDLPSDPVTDDLTPQTRHLINSFVDQLFVRKCARENVIWFKNWGSLKSIHAVEHFHVMLFNPDKSFIDEITHGDVPLAEKIRNSEAT